MIGDNNENKITKESKKYICNKCRGKFTLGQIYFVRVTKVVGNEDFDLCKDCFKKFKRWLLK